MTQNDETYQIVDDSSERSHFHIMPNIIEHLGLDVWEYRIYGALKSTAGDKGSCFKSNTTLCKQVGCSLPKLIQVKKSLEKRGLITIKKQSHASGGCMPDLITIVDLWGKNAMFVMQGGSKQDLGGGVNGVKGGSKRRLVKEDIKEEEQKEQQQAAPAAAVFSKEKKKTMRTNSMNPGLAELDIPDHDKLEIVQKYTHAEIDKALAWLASNTQPLRKSKAAALKWACKNGIEPQIAKQDLVAKNRERVQRCDGAHNAKKTIRIDVSSSHVELVFVTSSRQPEVLRYDVSDFDRKFGELLKKYEFTKRAT